MPESGLKEVIFFICTLIIWGQYPIFLHPEPCRDTQLGQLQWVMPKHPLFTVIASSIFLTTVFINASSLFILLFIKCIIQMIWDGRDKRAIENMWFGLDSQKYSAVQAGDHILGQNAYLLLKKLVVGLGEGKIKGVIIMYGSS